MIPLQTPATILLVDDEPQIHRFLRPMLEAAGYRVERAETAAEALRLAAQRSPDLVLLDLGLPDQDGRTVLEQLRHFSKAAVIVVSARDRPAEKIAALDAGANDYVEKPFDVGELLARIRAALRDTGKSAQLPEHFSNSLLEIDFAMHLVRVEGRTIPLTPREFGLLALLARNADRVITHRQLLTAVWGPAHGADLQYLRVYIGHLRSKLGTNATRCLITEPGIGYRLLSAAT